MTAQSRRLPPTGQAATAPGWRPSVLQSPAVAAASSERHRLSGTGSDFLRTRTVESRGSGAEGIPRSKIQRAAKLPSISFRNMVYPLLQIQREGDSWALKAF